MADPSSLSRHRVPKTTHFIAPSAYTLFLFPCWGICAYFARMAVWEEVCVNTSGPLVVPRRADTVSLRPDQRPQAASVR